MGAFNCVRERVCDFALGRSAPGTPDTVGHFANQNCRSDLLLHQRPKWIKTKTFILPASDENDRLVLCAQRFVYCVEIRRLGVVYISDAADFAHKFAPMRARLICTQRRHHLRERQSARHAGGECRHQILDVMQAAQFGIRQPQDRFVVINNRTL